MAITNQYSWGTAAAFTGEEIANWIPFKLDPDTLILDEDEPKKAVYHATTISNDMPETWEFGSTPITDVYSNYKIAKGNQANTASGRQILVKHSAFKRRFDTADNSYYKLIPLASHVVIKAPLNECVTVTDVQQELRRMAGGLLLLSADTTRLEKLMWGGVRVK